MTAVLLLDRPGSLCDGAPATAGPPPVTLEARLTAVLHAVRANGSSECPVCHGRISHGRTSRATSTRAGARVEPMCGDCGSRLA
jgi:hypothetical protein